MASEPRVVVVTGAGSGIGRAIARGFAGDGDQVVAFDRSADGLAVTRSGLETAIEAVRGDVTSDDDVYGLVRETERKFGRIDVLVNDAGIANMGTFLEVPFEDWIEVIQVNLVGLARCTRAVLSVMSVRGHGRILNVASRNAESATIRMSAYSASKAGVISFTRVVAREVIEAGAGDVLVNTLIPGPTDTPIWGRSRPELQTPDLVYPHAKFVADLPAGGPSGRVFWNSKEYRIYERFNDA